MLRTLRSTLRSNVRIHVLRYGYAYGLRDERITRCLCHAIAPGRKHTKKQLVQETIIHTIPVRTS